MPAQPGSLLAFVQAGAAAAQAQRVAPSQARGSNPPAAATTSRPAQAQSGSLLSFVNFLSAAEQMQRQQPAQAGSPAPVTFAQPQFNVQGSLLDFLKSQAPAGAQAAFPSFQPSGQNSIYTPDAFQYDPFGRAKGVDISYAEDSWNPSQASVPLDFVIMKASQGLNKDTNFQTFAQTAAQSNIPVTGAYHFLDSNVSVGGQVTTFLNQVSGKPFDFYAVDFEPYGNIKVNAQSAQMARDFIYQVSSITGKPTFLYTSGSTNSQFFNKPGDQNIPLWISSPQNGPNQFAPSKYITAGKPWAFWQYSYSAPASQFGINTAHPYQNANQGVDVNVFNGDLNALKNYLVNTAQMQRTLYGGGG